MTWKENQCDKWDQWVGERRNGKVVEYEEEHGSYKIYTYMKTILKINLNGGSLCRRTKPLSEDKRLLNKSPSVHRLVWQFWSGKFLEWVEIMTWIYNQNAENNCWMLSLQHLYHFVSKTQGTLWKTGWKNLNEGSASFKLLTDHELSVAVVPTKDPHEIGSVNMLS